MMATRSYGGFGSVDPEQTNKYEETYQSKMLCTAVSAGPLKPRGYDRGWLDFCYRSADGMSGSHVNASDRVTRTRSAR